MEKEEIDTKKEMLIGILGLTGVALFTIIGLIIKHMFFM